MNKTVNNRIRGKKKRNVISAQMNTLIIFLLFNILYQVGSPIYSCTLLTPLQPLASQNTCWSTSILVTLLYASLQYSPMLDIGITVTAVATIIMITTIAATFVIDVVSSTSGRRGSNNGGSVIIISFFSF